MPETVLQIHVFSMYTVIRFVFYKHDKFNKKDITCTMWRNIYIF